MAAKLLFNIFDLYTTVLLVADVYMLHHDPVRFIDVTTWSDLCFNYWENYLTVKLLFAQQANNDCVALHCCMQSQHGALPDENNRFPSVG